jgi:hypothetical protein
MPALILAELFWRSLNLPPIEEQHARIVEGGADGCVGAVQFAEEFGVGFELRGEEAAQFRKGGFEVDAVGVGGFVVDDPPGFSAGGERLKSGAEEAVYLHRAEVAGDDAGPADFAGFFGMRGEDPVAGGVVGGVEDEA